MCVMDPESKDHNLRQAKQEDPHGCIHGFTSQHIMSQVWLQPLWHLSKGHRWSIVTQAVVQIVPTSDTYIKCCP